MNASPVIIAALAAVVAAASLPGASSTDHDPLFRAKTTLVPVAVRALDRSGDPVVGLTASDFEVSEIVLGRGRLQGSSKGFDALLEFVKRASFERDRFAVVAFDRITDITDDREAILPFLEHYESEHEKIEASLQNR